VTRTVAAESQVADPLAPTAAHTLPLAARRRAATPTPTRRGDSR
jgi:hypothetical protein